MISFDLSLSLHATDALRLAGWSEDRVSDSEAILARLEEFGFPALPRAKSILENFGGLKIKFHGLSNWLYFDAIRPAKTYSRIGIGHLAELVGEPLCVVGMMPLADVFVTESGKIAVLGAEWYELSMIPGLGEYLDSMGMHSTDGWQTTQIPVDRRPPFNRTALFPSDWIHGGSAAS